MSGMSETNGELDGLKVNTSDSSEEETCATCFTDHQSHIGFNAKPLFKRLDNNLQTKRKTCRAQLNKSL